jgi:hypothetical protein
VEGDKDTVGAVTLTEPGADLVPSATDVAVTVTLRFAATVLGAVYVVAAPLAVAVGDTEPQGAVEHVTVHVTPLFDESFTTLAMKFTVCPESTLCGVDGETLTEISGGGGGGALAAPHPKLQTATTSAISIAMIDAKFFDFMTASPRFYAPCRSVLHFVGSPLDHRKRICFCGNELTITDDHDCFVESQAHAGIHNCGTSAVVIYSVSRRNRHRVQNEPTDIGCYAGRRSSIAVEMSNSCDAKRGGRRRKARELRDHRSRSLDCIVPMNAFE